MVNVSSCRRRPDVAKPYAEVFPRHQLRLIDADRAGWPGERDGGRGEAVQVHGLAERHETVAACVMDRSCRWGSWRQRGPDRVDGIARRVSAPSRRCPALKVAVAT